MEPETVETETKPELLIPLELYEDLSELGKKYGLTPDQIANRLLRKEMKRKPAQEMAKTRTKNFYVPASLYRELENAATKKGRTLTRYMDDLLGALACGEVVEHGN